MINNSHILFEPLNRAYPGLVLMMNPREVLREFELYFFELNVQFQIPCILNTSRQR